eukprot:scaffold40019_cov50-Attheya_sp.AAC.2
MARRALSNYAYHKLWIPSLMRIRHSQKEVCPNGDVLVWSIMVESPRDCDLLRIIRPNQMCPCRKSSEYLSQCEHEIVAVNGFDPKYFNHRWFNQWTFEREIQQLHFDFNASYRELAKNNMKRYTSNETNDMSDCEYPQNNDNHNSDDDDDSDNGGNSDNDQDNDECDDDPSISLDTNGHITQDEINEFHEDNQSSKRRDEDSEALPTPVHAPEETLLSQEVPQEKLSYNQVVARFQNLASIIQNDQPELCRIHNVIDDLIHHYRRKQTFEINIRTTSSSSSSSTSSLVALTKNNVNASKTGRKKSFREHQQKFATGKRRKTNQTTNSVASLVGQVSDDQFMRPPKQMKKPCKLCQEAGHRGYIRCPRILKYCESFGTVPIPRGSQEARGTLFQKLVKENTYRSYILPEKDERIVFKSLPRKVTGLILHKRFFRDGQIKNGTGIRSIVIEVTFLGDGALPIEKYEKALFEIDPISKWIVRSMTNIIVNQLEEIVNKDNSPVKIMQHDPYPKFKPISTEQASLNIAFTNDENIDPNVDMNNRI